MIGADKLEHRPEDAEALDELVPRLRRFAHVLTAARQDGDALVETALREFADDGTPPTHGRTLARDLFARLNRLWIVERAPETYRSSDAAQSRIYRLLAQLPSQQKQAVLLTRMERFTVAEAAGILNVDAEDLGLQLRRAAASMMMMDRARIFIIEDELPVALDLASLVEDMGHEVCGIAGTEGDAVTRAAREDLDLIVADVRLRDGSSGLQAVERLRAERTVPVVYVTAHGELVTSGRCAAGDVLVEKPYLPDTLRDSVNRALFGELERHRLN